MSRCTSSRLMLLMAVLALAGCDCGNPQPTCTDATLVFTLPDEGATVPGTFDAAIAATVNGAPFAFDAATLSVQGHTFSGAISNGTASFTGVTATAGSVELKASIAAGSCSKTVTRTVTVREDLCTAPTVLGVSFPQDTTAPLGVLNAAELPSGTALQVRVEAGCVSGVQVRIKRGVNVVGELTDFTNGVATLTLPTLPDADSAQYDLFAELVRDGVAVNQPVGAALGSIRVQRSNPSCALSDTAVIGPAQDAQPTVAGFQARVSGTMSADLTGSITVLNLTGAPTVPVTPNADGEVSADFTLPASTGSYTMQLTCVDSAGNITTTTRILQTDFDAPTVTITSPANNATVTASPLTMEVSVGPGEAGGLVQVLVNGQSVDAVMVDDTGVVHPSVSFAADGTYTVTVRATDVAGNSSEATVTVVVTLSGCGIAFTRPATSPALLTPAQLQSGTYSFQTTSKPECAGSTASLFRAAVQADGGLAVEEQVGTATLATGGVAAFSPLMMSNGAFRFRGEVVNPGDAGVSSATVQVTVDLDGPSITTPVVPSGQSFVTLSAFQDTQPGTPGVQRTLDFSALVPMGGRVDVCTTQAIDPVSGSQRPTSTECGAGWFLLQQGVVSPSPAFTFPEGSYSIKIVVVGGGVSPAPESAAVAIVADGTRPCVQANTLTLPQDTNGDGRLNAAELNGANPVLVFTPGCGDTPASLSATAPVTVRDLVSGAPGGPRAATAVYASGQYTVTLTGAYTTELDLNLFVQLSDQVANQNTYAGVGDPAAIAFRVDPVAPVCTIASPTAAVLGLSQVPAGALDVTVNTSLDVTSGVHLTFTGQGARDLTASQGTVTSQYSGLTGDNQVTIAATCTDAAGNVTTATPVTTRIDLSAPTCDITAPATGSIVIANEVQTTVAVTGVADGDLVILTSSLSGISNNQLTVAGGSATRLVRYPKGTQTVTATLADEAGNECVAPSGGHKAITLTVNNASCSLDFAVSGPISTNTNGSWLNRAGAGLPVSGTTPASASVAVGAFTADCGPGRNVYLYAGPASTTPSGTPQVTDLLGAVTFPSQAFNEGGEYTVTIDDGTGLLTHRSFIVSLKAPTVSSIGLQRSASNSAVVQVPRDAALTFGAFTGNHRVATALPSEMVFGDLNASLDGADLSLTLGSIDGATVAPFDATVEVLGVTAPVSQALGSDTSPTFSLKLPHQVGTSTVNLVIRVTSPAGNTYTSTHVSQVDVVAPAAPTVTQMLGAARTATVNLSWAAVNDDGTNAASGAPSYDVRWTTSSVPANNSMASEADFFGDSAKADGIDTAVSRALTLPPLNTYFIAARAVDEVGNYSTFAAPTALTNMWTELTLTVASAPADFGHTVLVTPNVAGSSERDIVISAPSTGGVGAVYVFQGSAALTSQSTCGTGCQMLAPPDATGSFFGSDVSVAGNLGDDASDPTTTGMADLVIGQRAYTSTSTGPGRVFIFFGSTGSISKSIEIRGDASNQIGWAATSIADLDGDGLGEVALTAHNFGSGRGRVYVFKGRSFSQWQAAFVAGQTYIDVTTANWVIEGEYLINTANSSNGLALNRNGVTTLPGVTGRTFPGGAPAPELLLSVPRANVSKLGIYSAAQVTASSAAAPLGAFDGGVQLVSGTPETSNSIVQGLGASVWGSGPVQRSDLADLYAGYPFENRVFRYSSWGTDGVTGGVATESFLGSNNFGSNVTSGDLNGDGHPELVVAEGVATNNGLWVLYQRAGSFDPSVGGPNVAFNVSQIRPVRSGGVFTQMPNRLVAVGDFGAGVSLVVSDATAGSVHVWK